MGRRMKRNLISFRLGGGGGALKSLLLHSLLSGVVELVLPSAIETLLSPGVGPNVLHSSKKLCGVRLRVLHTSDHVANQLSIRLDHIKQSYVRSIHDLITRNQ